jgi:nitrilase
MVMFPECYPGPCTSSVDLAAGEVLAAVAREHGVYIGFGYMERMTPVVGSVAKLYHNVYEVVGPDGSSAAKYAKMIPAGVDSAFSGKETVPGSDFALLDTPWGRVGILLCWEAWFPELCRTLAMRGADVVLFPSGGMLYHLIDVWGTLIQARATENLVYTAACVNLFGVEEGFARICGPEGELAASAEEGVLVADLDTARLQHLRSADETWTFPKHAKTIPGLWRHNRPDLYQPGAWAEEWRSTTR